MTDEYPEPMADRFHAEVIGPRLPVWAVPVLILAVAAALGVAGVVA